MSTFMNHTMLRIRDPKRSLDFYAKHFGMKKITELPVPSLGFTNYFIALQGPTSAAGDAPWYKRQGILELCHNHDAEEKGFVANNGNKEPNRGFGHICLSVNNLEQFCDKLEADGVKFQKKLQDGRQHNIAFALDPDGYWIELIENQAGDGIRFNHSMIRVKDKDASIKFYRDILGMELVRTSEHPNADFNLYFLGYTHNDPKDVSDREGLIELTWNYGTEKDADFHYHNGNSEPQGFGHFALAVPNVQEAMANFEKQGVKIVKNLKDGKMKFVAFIADPDGYWIEVLPQADFPEDIFANL